MKLNTPLLLAGTSLSLAHRAPLALYFLDNNPSGTTVISLPISPHNGTILSTPALRTPAGGVGSLGLTAPATPATADSTFSQNILRVSGTRLLTVSPGSNTLSIFSIDPKSPTHLTLLSDPISTGGDFPNSIAYSESLGLTCVLHTGGPKAGVSCFKSVRSTRWHKEKLVSAGQFMPLPGINQTSSPPLGPPGTGSDILFNPSCTALFVSVKGSGGAGYIYAFPIKGGNVIPKPVLSRPADLPVPFGMSFVSDKRAVVSDPSFGAAVVDIAYPSLKVTVAERVPVAGQVATCWTVYSKALGAVFLLDGGVPHVTVLEAGSGKILGTVSGAAAAGGLLDAAFAGKYLYALQGAAGVSVFEMGRESKVLQSLDLSGLGRRDGWMGMALYTGH